MRKTLLTLVLVAISTGIFAQDFEVPKNLKLDKPDDYALYEKDVLNCINWLMSTPINEQAEKRKEANAFFIMWLTGTPNVQVDINSKIVNFMKSSPDLLIIFMVGWTKYSIETQDSKDKVAGNLAGIEAVIEFYSKNKANMKKDKNVEKYIKMKEDGTLKEFIEKNA
jgi:hypothetical protein